MITSENNKNNYISIAKAIGIILMVIGHSGSPTIVCRFLYLFHMPLFFFCSGYFFKDISGESNLKMFCVKRVKGLYWPYLKWSLLFLLLHNVFCYFNIYNYLSNISYYCARDYIVHFLKTVLMTDYELLLRPFWFIKALLYSSLFVAIISYLCIKVFKKSKIKQLLFLMMVLSMFLKYNRVELPLLGDLSIISFGVVFFCSGTLYRRYEYYFPYTISLFVLTFVIVMGGSFFIKGEIDMRYVTIDTIIPYYILAITGIVMTFTLSSLIDKISVSHSFYFVGNHTMIILVFNLLALKVGNILKIYYYDLSIINLASYPIIRENNELFWIVYAICGISLPLIFNVLTSYICMMIKK